MFGDTPFEQSILRQIKINQARTPTQRFLALCELREAARAMMPTDPAAQERYRRAKAVREREREQWRAEYRRLFAANQTDPASEAD